jgi:rubrerythrin
MSLDNSNENEPQRTLREWEEHLLTYRLSEWEARLLRHFREHTETEGAMLETYAELAERSPDEFIRYLLTMLLDDETRHHRMFQELANSVVGAGNVTRIEPDIPLITHISDPVELRDLTAKLLRLEEEDQRELHRLHKELKLVRKTTLWDLLISLAERDTEKHRLILEFVHRQAVETIS